MNNQNLTVVVLDSKGSPAAGAQVSITPSDASAKTNSAGEVQFKLGTALKYDVTATVGSDTVTVPYYVTKNGSTRLVINPAYVKTVEKQLHPSTLSSTPFLVGGIVLGIIIVFIVIWKIFRRR